MNEKTRARRLQDSLGCRYTTALMIIREHGRIAVTYWMNDGKPQGKLPQYDLKRALELGYKPVDAEDADG